MNIASDVQDICFDRASVLDDVPSIEPALAEVWCLDPFRSGFLRPSIGNFSKRMLNAEVPKGAFFTEEPGDGHESKINVPNSCGMLEKCFSRTLKYSLKTVFADS